MKKLFNLAVLLMALTVTFTSCKKEEELKGEKVDLLGAYYYPQPEYSSMDLSFISEGSMQGEEIVKDDFAWYVFSIVVAEPGPKLANGTYTEKDLDHDFSWIVPDGIAGIQNNNYLSVKTAKIVVKDNLITASFTGSDGATYEMYYKGEITFEEGRVQ